MLTYAHVRSGHGHADISLVCQKSTVEFLGSFVEQNIWFDLVLIIWDDRDSV